MKKIIVATDGSAAGQRAMAWAASLAGATGSEVVAVSVLDARETVDDWFEARENLERALLEEWTDPLGQYGVPHTAVVLEGDPREVLVTLAAAEDADLLAVGTHGRGGFQGLGLGGVAHYLARHLPVPLVAIPHAAGRLRHGALVVGADGSPANEPALRWAADTAKAVDGRAVAVFVHSPLADVMTHPAPNWRYRGEDEVRAAVRRIELGGSPVDVLLVAGDPVQSLNDVAEDVDAGMIVVGRRGRGAARGTVLGRVPAQMLHHAVRPVVVVPH